MGKFYKEIHAAATAAKTANDVSRSARASAKALTEALQALFTSIAAKGEFSCLMLGSEDLANTDTVRLSTMRIDKNAVIEVPAELADVIASRLEKPWDFALSFHSVGIVRISWSVPEKDTV